VTEKNIWGEEHGLTDYVDVRRTEKGLQSDCGRVALANGETKKTGENFGTEPRRREKKGMGICIGIADGIFGCLVLVSQEKGEKKKEKGGKDENWLRIL